MCVHTGAGVRAVSSVKSDWEKYKISPTPNAFAIEDMHVTSLGMHDISADIG